MQIGTALFLLATGAILKYAVTDSVDGINLETVGVILMIVGAVGIVLSLLMMSRGPRDGVVVEREREHVDPRVR